MKRRWNLANKSFPSAKKCKIHLMVYREWQQKTSYIDAAKKISKLFGRKRTIISTQTKELYQRFENGEKQSSLFEKDVPLYENDSKFLNVSSIQSDGTSKHLLNSLLFMKDDMICSSDEILISNKGYFTISSYSCKSNTNQRFIRICDFFKDTEKSSPISFNESRLGFKNYGNYLVAETEISPYGPYALHLLKVNYDNLNVEEIGTINTDSHYFLLDQLNDQKFMIYGYGRQSEYILGQVQNDKIVMGNAENFDIYSLSKKRLIGNLVQYFKYDRDDIASSMKFCELNLDTKETKEMDANIDLGDVELTFQRYDPRYCCWSKDRYYGMFETTEKWWIHRLLAFDPQTLKWSDVKIWASLPQKIFVDENEILTVQVNANVSYPSALYRIALRKPEKLMNLTCLFALRESNLYKNDKYIKNVRQLPIQM